MELETLIVMISCYDWLRFIMCCVHKTVLFITRQYTLAMGSCRKVPTLLNSVKIRV